MGMATSRRRKLVNISDKDTRDGTKVGKHPCFHPDTPSECKSAWHAQSLQRELFFLKLLVLLLTAEASQFPGIPPTDVCAMPSPTGAASIK